MNKNTLFNNIFDYLKPILIKEQLSPFIEKHYINIEKIEAVEQKSLLYTPYYTFIEDFIDNNYCFDTEDYYFLKLNINQAITHFQENISSFCKDNKLKISEIKEELFNFLCDEANNNDLSNYFYQHDFDLKGSINFTQYIKNTTGAIFNINNKSLFLPHFDSDFFSTLTQFNIDPILFLNGLIDYISPIINNIISINKNDKETLIGYLLDITNNQASDYIESHQVSFPELIKNFHNKTITDINSSSIRENRSLFYNDNVNMVDFIQFITKQDTDYLKLSFNTNISGKEIQNYMISLEKLNFNNNDSIKISGEIINYDNNLSLKVKDLIISNDSLNLGYDETSFGSIKSILSNQEIIILNQIIDISQNVNQSSTSINIEKIIDFYEFNTIHLYNQHKKLIESIPENLITIKEELRISLDKNIFLEHNKDSLHNKIINNENIFNPLYLSFIFSNSYPYPIEDKTMKLYVDYYIEANKDSIINHFNEKNNPLLIMLSHQATEKKHSYALEKFKKFNLDLMNSDEFNNFLILLPKKYILSRSFFEPIINEFIEHPLFNPKYIDINGSNFLHHCSNIDLSKKLCSLGMNPTQINNFGQKIFHNNKIIELENIYLSSKISVDNTKNKNTQKRIKI